MSIREGAAAEGLTLPAVPDAHRVCISGIGAISPFAEGWPQIVERLAAGQPSFEPWTVEQDPPCPGARLGLVRQFSRDRFFSDRQLRLMDRSMALSCTAVGLALEDAALRLDDGDQGDDVAIMMGSMRGELPSLYRFGGPLFRDVRGALNPALFPTIARNISCGQAAIRFGLRGWSSMISAGEISGAHVLARAREMVACGRSQIAVAGAFEALSPISLHHIRARARKYGREHLFAAGNELVPTEGACFLVLENLQHAQARGIRPYALLEPAVHGYVTPGGDAVLDQVLARQAARRAAAHTDIDLLLPGTALDTAEAPREDRLLRQLRQRQPASALELRLRSWFGDAGALSSLFQTAVAAQLLQHGSTGCSTAWLPDTARIGAALTSTVTDRGAYCVNTLRPIAESVLQEAS